MASALGGRAAAVSKDEDRGAVWSSLWPLSCTCSVARMGATTWDRPADPSIIASLSTMMVASAAIQRHAFTVVLGWSQEIDRIIYVFSLMLRVKGRQGEGRGGEEWVGKVK